MASAQDFVLRARLGREIGDEGSAAADIELALQRDPADVEANLAALQGGDAAARVDAAARILAGGGCGVRGLREAIRVKLAGDGGVVHRLRPHGVGAAGWLAWSGSGSRTLGLRSSEGDWTVEIEPDPSHGLAGEGYAIADVALPDVLAVFDSPDGKVLFRRPERFVFDDRRAAAPPEAAALSVIVPIYDGYEATEACLASLFAQRDIVFSTILVDDASPDPRLSELAEAFARRPGITLLRNDGNQGFARSVNRALALTGGDDVVVLNADTILPSRAMARLRAAVANEPSVGTATPFSNNGQVTSFPRPFVVNALPSAEGVAAIDEIAFAVNGADLVDVPTGIGFCLYIRRACLDAVGPLPERYGRGYYEDTEFCLIARQRGFRNVCATGVFVGHAGSVSFKSDKGALTLRNLAILEERFPRQGREYLAFAQADPLRAARAAIEERLPPDVSVTLLLASDGRAHWQARWRARDLHARGEAAILVDFPPDGDRVTLGRAEQGAPDWLRFGLDEPGRGRLGAYLRGLRIRAVEMFDPARTPDALLDAIFALPAPTDLVCVGPWAMRDDPARRPGACPTPEDAGPCDDCSADAARAADPSGEPRREARLARTLRVARRVRSVDRMGAAYASRMFGARAEPLDGEHGELLGPPGLSGQRDPRALGVLAPIASVEGDRLLVRLSRKLAARGDETRIVVLGCCFNEAEVVAAGSALVVGSDDFDDYPRLARIYGLGRLASLDRSGLFGPLDRLSRQMGAPKAYFDWSFGGCEAAPGDLVIDPGVCDEKAATAVAFWLNAD